MLACPVCPAMDKDPAGWFRFRLQVSTETGCVEWWHRENLMFVAGLAVVVLSAVSIGLVAWARRARPPDGACDFDDAFPAEAGPMAKRRKMPPAVAALLEEHIKRSESVWHWSQLKPDEVTVQLITKPIAATVKKVMGDRGLGGCGRSLHFQKVSGRWTFIGSGRWIS